jgi:hypothetical protein
MAKRKLRPPSRVRYELNNPTVSFRVSRELHERLKEELARRQISFADLVKESLGVQAKHEMQFPCAICGKYFTVYPDTDSYRKIAKILNERGWAHTKCREERKQKASVPTGAQPKSKLATNKSEKIRHNLRTPLPGGEWVEVNL